MAKLGKSLDDLLRKPTMFRDDSFPASGDVVLRNRRYYWAVGGLVFLVLVTLMFINVWAGLERSWVGRGELETWVWRFGWWKRLALEAWRQGPLSVLAFSFGAGAFPQIGNVVDFALLSFPLEAVLGAPSYYNVKVALVVCLNCVACWWFFERIWGAGLSSWLGAFLFGFNSFFLRELAEGRCRSALAFAVPLCLGQLYALYKAPANRKSALVAGLWLGLGSLLFAPYGAVLVCIVVGWWLFGYFRRPEQRRDWTLGILLLFGVGLAMYLPWGWCTGGIVSPGYAGGIANVAQFPAPASVEQAQEVLPVQAEILARQPGGEEQIALGEARSLWQSSLPVNAWWSWNCRLALPLLALVFIAVPYAYNWRFPWLWWVFVGGFAILSFGPFLSLERESAGLQVVASWSLPWAWLFRILPAGFRLPPASFLVGLHLALAVLVVQRLRAWNLRLPTLTHAVALALLCAQLWQLNSLGVFPLPATRMENGPLVYLLGDSAPQGLIDVPWGGYYVDLAQEVHCCPVLGAEATRWFPSSWPTTGTDAVSRWAGARLDWNNSFAAHLAKYQADGRKWENYARDDIAKLRADGYALLILHERGCNILAGNRGEILYFKYYSHLCECLGEPLVSTFEPVYEGLPGCRNVDVNNPRWYRVSAFKL